MDIKKILSTILVVLWMIVVFYFSNQPGSGSSNTSNRVTRIIVNIYDIKNEMTQQQREEMAAAIDPIVRKLAHYTIYLIGGVLLVSCACAYLGEEKKSLVCACVSGVVYAISDEIHQLFIIGRSGKVEDVIIDSLGVFTGVILFMLGKKIVVDRNKKRGRI